MKQLFLLLALGSMQHAMHRAKPLVSLPKATSSRVMIPQRSRAHYSTAKPNPTLERLKYHKERVADARSEYLRHSTEYICAALVYEQCESQKFQCSYDYDRYCACQDRMKWALKDAKQAGEDLDSARETLYEFKLMFDAKNLDN